MATTTGKAPAKKSTASAARKKTAAEQARAAANTAAKQQDPNPTVPKRLQFETTPFTDAELEARPRLHVDLDGLTLTVVKPDDSYLAMLHMQLMNSTSSEEDQGTTILAFALNVLEPASRAVVRRRLENPSDSFGMEVLSQIMRTVLDEWVTG